MKKIIKSYKKIFKRYWRQLAVFALVWKILILAGVFVVIPVQARSNIIESEAEMDLPEIKFDVTKENPIQVIRKNPEIKPVVSRYEINRRAVLARAAVGRFESYPLGSINYGDLSAFYLAAEKEYGVPALILRAVASLESGEGTTMRASRAGAVGFGQFMPGTWRKYGGNGNPYDPKDAIPAMARLLASNGAADNTKAGVRQALLAYNHADWYVTKVLRLAAQFGYVIPE